MTASWSTAPYTIHVNGDPSGLAEAATASGARVLRWSLAGIRGRRDLESSAARVFEFPFPSASLAGLVDMLADLEWLGVEGGVLFVIDAHAAHESVVEDVATILPYIADRWRSGAATFEAFLVGVADTVSVARVLEKNNVALDEFGRLDRIRSYTSRVPVVVHP
jgi:hypothetical protein